MSSQQNRRETPCVIILPTRNIWSQFLPSHNSKTNHILFRKHVKFGSYIKTCENVIMCSEFQKLGSNGYTDIKEQK